MTMKHHPNEPAQFNNRSKNGTCGLVQRNLNEIQSRFFKTRL